jgi:hypothetical protein
MDFSAKYRLCDETADVRVALVRAGLGLLLLSLTKL